MYLVEIDPETGLVKLDPTNDSWAGIKDFREVVEKYDLKVFTCIALSCDYLSVFRHYSNEDRPFRAMDEIYGNRNELDFENDEVILKAKEKYFELQFNADLEQEQINKDIKLRYLKSLTEANRKSDDVEIEKYNRLLQKHQTSINTFNDSFDRQEALSQAVTKNGYRLSRIENDIVSRKNSKFVTHGIDIQNPNKLDLNQEKSKT